MTKYDKARLYSQNWDKNNPDLLFEDVDTGKVSEIDFLAGYEQALKDSKAKEMREMLIDIQKRIENSEMLYLAPIKQLIKSTTEL